MRQVCSTLAAIGFLGGVAAADPGEAPAAAYAGAVEISGSESSHRGVAQDYQVAPSGGEVSAQMRFITADSLAGGPPLKFSDLALFGVSARYSLFSRLEIGGDVEMLPKQPTYTDESAWQSASLGLRSALGQHAALALSGAGGHLLGHEGYWTREAAMLELKKPIDREWLSFEIKAGVDVLGVKTDSSSAFLTELAVLPAALFREPTGHWGGWLGFGYAVPVQHSGIEPVSGMAIQPKPRLDFHVGTVLAIVPQWDLFIDFAVIDRGDSLNPATQLPILDGGFDQKQIIFGVTRHVASGDDRGRHSQRMDLAVAE